MNHSAYQIRQPKRLQHIEFVNRGCVYSGEVLGRNNNYDDWQTLSTLQSFMKMASSSV